MREFTVLRSRRQQQEDWIQRVGALPHHIYKRTPWTEKLKPPPNGRWKYVSRTRLLRAEKRLLEQFLWQLESHCILRHFILSETVYSTNTLCSLSIFGIIKASWPVVASPTSVKICNLWLDSATLPMFCYRKFVITNIDSLASKPRTASKTSAKTFQETLARINRFYKSRTSPTRKKGISKTISYSLSAFLSYSYICWS